MSRPVQLVTALFLATVMGSWAWFRVAPPTDREALRFEVHREIPGWRFVADPVPEQHQEILATTNLFNGTFVDEPSGASPIIVFAAEWDGSDVRQRAALPHTPDICWVGAGWVPIEAGQPAQIAMPVSGSDVPFQCRVFQAPNGQQQLVAWCSVLGGKPVEDTGAWKPEGETAGERKAQNLNRLRSSGFNHFLRAVRDRDGAEGFKQFVRLSVSIAGEHWQPGLDRLREFSPRWLELDRSSGGARIESP